MHGLVIVSISASAEFAAKGGTLLYTRQTILTWLKLVQTSNAVQHGTFEKTETSELAVDRSLFLTRNGLKPKIHVKVFYIMTFSGAELNQIERVSVPKSLLLLTEAN